MDVDFCPNCKKAGLRYEDPEGHYPSDYVPLKNYGAKKWCPRCKIWVSPKAHNVMGCIGDGNY